MRALTVYISKENYLKINKQSIQVKKLEKNEHEFRKKIGRVENKSLKIENKYNESKPIQI